MRCICIPNGISCHDPISSRAAIFAEALPSCVNDDCRPQQIAIQNLVIVTPVQVDHITHVAPAEVGQALPTTLTPYGISKKCPGNCANPNALQSPVCAGGFHV